MDGRDFQNGPLTEQASYLGTDRVARVTAHCPTSRMVGNSESRARAWLT